MKDKLSKIDWLEVGEKCAYVLIAFMFVLFYEVK